MRILPSIAVLTVALLSGCLPAESPSQPPAPQPTSTPVFASEEEALAAAVEAYAAYSAMSDQVAIEGGAGAERLGEFVTDEWLTKEVAAFSGFAQTGNRQVGLTQILSTSLQQYSAVTNDGAQVVLYACLDFSATSFVDKAGIDVTPVTRANMVTIEVTLESTNRGSLKVSYSEPWSGDSVC